MLKVYGSMLCPDCVNLKKNLDEYQIGYEFTDICVSMKNLKEFLKLRDGNELFDDVRKNGMVGIPAIMREDGSTTLDWKNLIREFGHEPVEEDTGIAACDLNHRENC